MYLFIKIDLVEFSYENSALSTSTPEKLYAAIQDKVGPNVNVTEVMSIWVEQLGYPVLNVNISNDRKTLCITQKRFLRDNVHYSDKTLWKIPITFASDKYNSNFSGSTSQFNFLSNESMHISLPEEIIWIIFNVQQSGEYFLNQK